MTDKYRQSALNQRRLKQIFTKSDGTLANVMQHLQNCTLVEQKIRSLLNEESNKHCCGVYVKNGTVVILCDGAHWATRLRFQCGELLANLRSQHGLYHIRSVSCKVQPATASEDLRRQLSNRPKPHISQDNGQLFLSVANSLTADDPLAIVMKRLAARAQKT